MSQSDNRWMLKAAPVWSMPFLVPVAVGIGLGLGLWLDSKLGTEPWLAICLTLVGLAAGVYESAIILIEASRGDNE